MYVRIIMGDKVALYECRRQKSKKGHRNSENAYEDESLECHLTTKFLQKI